MILVPFGGGAQAGLPVRQARFDDAAFDAGMFGRAGIACREHFARSVRKRQAE